MQHQFKHQPDQNRFVLDIDGQEAFIDYTQQQNILSLTHTLVPVSLRGQGVGKILIEQCFNHIREQKQFAKPVCSYIVLYAKRNHSQWADILDIRE